MKRKASSVFITMVLLLVCLASCQTSKGTEPVAIANGQTISIGGFDIAVQGQTMADMIEMGETVKFQPETHSQVYLNVSLSVKNTKNELHTFLPSQYNVLSDVSLSLETPGYVAFDPIVLDGYDAGIATKDVAAGETITGDVTFLVPRELMTADTPFTFVANLGDAKQTYALPMTTSE